MSPTRAKKRLITLLVLLAILSTWAWKRQAASVHVDVQPHAMLPALNKPFKGALMATRFESLEEFRQRVEIDYFAGEDDGLGAERDTLVRLRHQYDNQEVVSELSPGVSQEDFIAARDGGFFDKVGFGFQVPFAVWHKQDLVNVFLLSRRKSDMFGAGDIAFYDLAMHMVNHLSEEDRAAASEKDLGAKGYHNTFNHITAQAFVTSIYSEELADFLADVHERYNMIEVITGQFTQEQLNDPDNNPVDNYVDMINNEWGQRLGLNLRSKYGIDDETQWTPSLLTNYLNDIQQYYIWNLEIGMEPFRETDEIIIRFSQKLNDVLSGNTE